MYIQNLVKLHMTSTCVGKFKGKTKYFFSPVRVLPDTRDKIKSNANSPLSFI